MNPMFIPFAGLAAALAVAEPGPLPTEGFLAPPAETLSAPADGKEPSSDEPKVEASPVRGSSIERVRATLAVDAPADKVRGAVFDFARYPDFMPGYKRATVLRVNPDGSRLVQFEIEQMGGMVKLWMRVDIAAGRREGQAEVYDGKLTEGNVKAFQARWKIEPMDNGKTKLAIESYVDPDIAIAPSGMVNKRAREGVRTAILALKSRSEGRSAAR